MSTDQTRQVGPRQQEAAQKVHVSRSKHMCKGKGGTCLEVCLSLENDRGSGEADSQGLHRKGEEGNDAVLPPQAGLFSSSCQRGHHMELTLGKRTRMGYDKSRKREENKNVPEGGSGDTAAQLIKTIPCAHVNVCRAQVAGRGLVWLQDHPAHRAMQRVVTLRPSGPAEPCL